MRKLLLTVLPVGLLLAGCGDPEARKGVEELKVRVASLEKAIGSGSGGGGNAGGGGGPAAAAAWAAYSADDVFQDPDRVSKLAGAKAGDPWAAVVEYRCPKSGHAGRTVATVTVPGEGSNTDAQLSPATSAFRLVTRGESDGASVYLQSSEDNQCRVRKVEDLAQIPAG